MLTDLQFTTIVRLEKYWLEEGNTGQRCKIFNDSPIPDTVRIRCKRPKWPSKTDTHYMDKNGKYGSYGMMMDSYKKHNPATSPNSQQLFVRSQAPSPRSSPVITRNNNEASPRHRNN
jgi:hypothetical protein